jgi:hypothetical protein
MSCCDLLPVDIEQEDKKSNPARGIKIVQARPSSSGLQKCGYGLEIIGLRAAQTANIIVKTVERHAGGLAHDVAERVSATP